MMLEELAKHQNLTSAARAFAGNWRHWRHFFWPGADDIPDSENVALGYLTNHQGGYEQETHHRVVRLRLREYWGDLRNRIASVDDFGSSLCGDPNVLNGIMIVVYDGHGDVTPAFRDLYRLARHICNKSPETQDRDIQDIREEELRKEIRWVVDLHLEDICKRRKIEYDLDLPALVTNHMASDPGYYYENGEDYEDQVEAALEDLLTN